MNIKVKKIILIAVLLLVVLILPLVIENTYVVHVMIMVLIYILLTIGQNIITGYTGMLSMGQAGFYGIGAYIAALMNLHTNVNGLLCMIIAAIVTFLFGLLLGIPCVRLGSDYLTLMTIGFGVIIQLVFMNWDAVTHGAMGLRGLAPITLFGYEFLSYESIFYLYFIITAILYIFVSQFLNSRYGRAFFAIRDDEIAAAAMGINIPYFKVLAYGIGSMLAGIAGWMLANFILFVGPNTFSTDESILHMEMAILGGLGSMPGSILGAALLTIIPQILQSIYAYRQMVNGFLMVVLMIWRPQGLIGKSASGKSVLASLESLVNRLTGRKHDSVIQ